MRAVLREMGGMEFHKKVRDKYFPRTPRKGTDEVMVSVRAASINPDDYKVFFFFIAYFRICASSFMIT